MPDRAEREELRRRVEDLHRDHPDWAAREIEAGLKDRAPVAYGNWRDETPSEDSRLRAIQRWRSGGRWAANGSILRVPFPYAWPVRSASLWVRQLLQRRA